jgi:mRNA interferase MazF
VIRRGEIWWADFGDPRGSEPAHRHPALVVQRDEVNASAINTVVVCALTSNQRLATAPGNTLLPRRVTRLPRSTVVNASQIATVNKTDLVERVSTLPSAWMGKVEDGLRWFLHLDLAEQ